MPVFSFALMTILIPLSSPWLSKVEVAALWFASLIVTIAPFFVSNVAYWLLLPCFFASRAFANAPRNVFSLVLGSFSRNLARLSKLFITFALDALETTVC